MYQIFPFLIIKSAIEFAKKKKKKIHETTHPMTKTGSKEQHAILEI